jgi:hypothetical protein
MKEVGKIVAILNNEFFLCETNVPLEINTEVLVVGKIESQEIIEILNRELIIPKGKLNTMYLQLQKDEKYIYLMSTKFVERNKTVLEDFTVNNFFGLASGNKIVKEKVADTVAVDESNNLNLKISKLVNTGDYLMI